MWDVCGHVNMRACVYVCVCPCLSLEMGPCRKKSQPDCVRVGAASTNLLHKRRNFNILQLPVPLLRESYEGIHLTRETSQWIPKFLPEFQP